MIRTAIKVMLYGIGTLTIVAATLLYILAGKSLGVGQYVAALVFLIIGIGNNVAGAHALSTAIKLTIDKNHD